MRREALLGLATKIESPRRSSATLGQRSQRLSCFVGRFLRPATAWTVQCMLALEPGAPPPVVMHQHHAERIKLAISQQQLTPLTLGDRVISFDAIHHCLVRPHRSSTFLHLLLSSRDHNAGQGMVRIFELGNDTSRPTRELLPHHRVRLPEGIEYVLDTRAPIHAGMIEVFRGALVEIEETPTHYIPDPLHERLVSTDKTFMLGDDIPKAASLEG